MTSALNKYIFSLSALGPSEIPKVKSEWIALTPMRTDTCYLFPSSRRDRGVAFNTLHIVEINVFTAEFPAAYYPEVLVWVCWQEKKWSIL